VTVVTIPSVWTTEPGGAHRTVAVLPRDEVRSADVTVATDAIHFDVVAAEATGHRLLTAPRWSFASLGPAADQVCPRTKRSRGGPRGRGPTVATLRRGRGDDATDRNHWNGSPTR
jgi:hypothetical protein